MVGKFVGKASWEVIVIEGTPLMTVVVAPWTAITGLDRPVDVGAGVLANKVEVGIQAYKLRKKKSVAAIMNSLKNTHVLVLVADPDAEPALLKPVEGTAVVKAIGAVEVAKVSFPFPV